MRIEWLKKISSYIAPVTFLLILLLTLPAFSQAADSRESSTALEKSLYENTLLQVEFLIAQQPPQDSLIYNLIEDARDFAARQNWEEGREILNTVFAIYEADVNDLGKSPENAAVMENSNTEYSNLISPEITSVQFSSHFQIESGIDYSQQEFELSFLENDSTLVEELQNPYVSLTYFQTIVEGNRSLALNHRLRLDHQFFNYDLLGTMERRTDNRVSRAELEGNYFHSQNAGETDFLDSRAMFFYGNPYNFTNRWYGSVQSRFKWYPRPDSLGSNIFSLGLNGYYEYFFNGSMSFGVGNRIRAYPR